MTTNIVNMCAHEVHEINSNIKYPGVERARATRVDMSTVSKGKVNGVETFVSKALPTKNLPAPKDNTLFIVSSLVLAQHPDRMDLLAPGIPKRLNGTPVGCSGFRRN
jgi:hypothetical protein